MVIKDFIKMHRLSNSLRLQDTKRSFRRRNAEQDKTERIELMLKAGFDFLGQSQGNIMRSRSWQFEKIRSFIQNANQVQ